MVSVSKWFQADVRAARVMRAVRCWWAKGNLVWRVAKMVACGQLWLCHDDSPRALEKVSQKVLHPLATESFKANWGCQRTSRAVIGAGTTSWGHRKGAPNNRINTDAALRASVNGRSGFV